MGYFLNICSSYNDIINNNGLVVENKDGTVSAYIPSTFTSGYEPLPLSKFCCEALKVGYFFDLDSQKCKWSTTSTNCSLDSFKLTLNPIGNDGNMFFIDSNVDNTEKCFLNIEFDYIFKVSCESLTNILYDNAAITTNANGCLTPIDVLENLDVSVLLEYVDSTNKLVTVATYPLFTSIGTGNLYDYLNTNPDSGFLVCGEPNAKEKSKGITGCTPIYLESNSNNNVSVCDVLITNIINGLLAESALDKITFDNSFNKNSLASKWLHYQTTISDETILAKITNKKIKLTIQVNSSCGEFCILLDNIQLNRDCSLVTENKMFISTPPNFNLTRVIDNKKSWVANTTPENRPFHISNALGGSDIRQTNYNVNDERLVINTKEIDLDMDIASAIETDVFCYVNDNPCLLETSCNLLECYEDVLNVVNYSDAVDSGLISPLDVEDFFTAIRAGRDSWLKAWNELMLATAPYMDIKNGIKHPNPSEEVMGVYDGVKDAWTKALNEFNVSNGAGGIDGLTYPGIIDNYTEYARENYTSKEQFAPFIFNTKCGRIYRTTLAGEWNIYIVETETKEAKAYFANVDFAPRTTWIDITSLIQEEYPKNYNNFNQTPEKAPFYCGIITGHNYKTQINMISFHYQNNDNASHNEWVNSVDNNFFLDWDSKKGKCMTNMFKESVPEEFSMHYPITSKNQWANYMAANILSSTPHPPECFIDVYLRNSGNTSCSMFDFSWPNIASEISTMNRAYRDYTLKYNNETFLTTKGPLYQIYLIDPNTNMVPDESAGFIPVKVTTTIRKGSRNGSVVYKEEYVLNDIAATCSYNQPTPATYGSDGGLKKLRVYIGLSDPNSAYWDQNAGQFSFDINYINNYGTILSGTTSKLPIPGASENAIDRNWEFDIEYYVHYDVVNNITGDIYHVTNNDFNLRDKLLPLKCPSSASTQTFNIGDALHSIDKYKTTILGQIKEDLDNALAECIDC